MTFALDRHAGVRSGIYTPRTDKTSGWPLYRRCSCTARGASALKRELTRAFLSIFSVRSFTHANRRKAYRTDACIFDSPLRLEHPELPASSERTYRASNASSKARHVEPEAENNAFRRLETRDLKSRMADQLSLESREFYFLAFLSFFFFFMVFLFDRWIMIVAAWATRNARKRETGLSPVIKRAIGRNSPLFLPSDTL